MPENETEYLLNHRHDRQYNIQPTRRVVIDRMLLHGFAGFFGNKNMSIKWSATDKKLPGTF